jgi:hypothetical protein
MNIIQWCGVLILAMMAVAYVVSLASICAKPSGYTFRAWTADGTVKVRRIVREELERLNRDI